MDVSITLKGKHEGEPIEVMAIGCSVHEEPQTWTEPGSVDVDYEDVRLVIADESEDTLDGTSLSDELRELYDEVICDAIYEAWRDQEPY
jgi:hypothetical protein